MTLDRPHVHRWAELRRGIALRLCKCGAVRTPVDGLKVGENTISLSPAGVGDVMRWSASKTAVALGDIGMNKTTGRMSFFINGDNRDIPFSGEMTDGGDRRRSWGIQVNASLTTINNSGFATAPTVNGTPSVINVATGEGTYIQYASAAGLGSDAGWISTAFSQTQLIYEPFYDASVRASADISSQRWWVGLFSATPMASATPAVSYAAFRYDTGAGDANWQCVTDNGSGVPTVTNSTVAVTGTTSYRLRIVILTGSGTVLFFINGVLRATHTTTLPAVTTDLGHVEQLRNLVAAARSMRVGMVRVSQKAA